jgi:hypothetical protein
MHATAIVAAAAGGITLLIRLALYGRSFDLFGDEVIYTELGHSVVSGGFPQCCGGGDFFLHGPSFFYLAAGWERLLGNAPGLLAQVYQLRMLNALLAVATAVVLVLLATRASSLRVGAVTGLLFALEPFCIRENDRVMLETGLMLWVMLGYLVFTSLIGRLPSRRDWPRAVGAGLLFGCAALTKDEGALLTVFPLLAAAALRWGPRRALTLLTVGTTVAVYAAYVAVAAANGLFRTFWEAKTSGVQRMAGLVQASGFRQSQGGGSLSARLIAEALSFGTTYVVLALAVPAVVVLLLRGGQLQRMLGLIYCAAGVILAYDLVLGTLEEQDLYLLIVPSLLVVPVATALLLDESRRFRRPRRRRRRWRPWTAVITVALTLTISLNLATFVQRLRQPDNGFAQLFRYMAAHVPVGTRVGQTALDEVAEYALSNWYQVGIWPTPAALSEAHARYLLVEWGPVNEGYSDPPSQVRHLVGHDRLVFSFRGPTYGQLALYELPQPSASVRTRRKD